MSGSATPTPTPTPAPEQEQAPVESSESDLDAMFDREFTAEVPDPAVPAATEGEDPPAIDPAPSDGGQPSAAQPAPAPAAPSTTAAPAAPAADVKTEPAPAPAPAQEPPRPEKPALPDPEQRAQLIRAAKRELAREEREWVRETGRPLDDPAAAAEDVEADRSLEELRAEYPEIYKAIMAATRPFVRRDDLDDFQASLRDQVREGTISTATEVALTQVVAVHPDWAAVIDQSNPKSRQLQDAVWAAVDQLPHKDAAVLEEALLRGTPAEASRAIAEFKRIKGISDVHQLLQDGSPPAGEQPPAQAPAQPTAPAAPPRPAPVNQERMAAAQAIPGEGTHAPSIPARVADLPLTDQDLDREFNKAWAEA